MYNRLLAASIALALGTVFASVPPKQSDGPLGQSALAEPAVAVADQEGPDKIAIAARVRARFAESDFIRIKARIEDDEGVLVVDSLMGADRFRTIVSQEGGPVAGLALVNGRVQEYVPTARLRGSRPHRLIVEYDALPEDSGQPRSGNQILISPQIGCRFGEFTHSWIRPVPNDVVYFFAAMIEGGTLHEAAEIDGRNCLVFRHERIFPESRHIVDMVAVDGETGDVRRWETVRTRFQPPETSRRVATYTTIEHAATDDGWVWHLDPAHVELAAQTDTGAPAGSPVETSGAATAGSD